MDVTNPTPNFLAGGGIGPNPVAADSDPAIARAATAAFIQDQEVPYSISYSLSFQRQFLKNWAIEARYLGTRGIHLFTQNRLNARARITDTEFLPTFLSAPSQAQLDALSLSLDQLQARSRCVPSYDAAGFNGNDIVAFISNGITYHVLSSRSSRLFRRGLQGSRHIRGVT